MTGRPLAEAASLGTGLIFRPLRRFAGAIPKISLLSDNQTMREAIMRDPEVMHGTPVFQGTRVPVQTLFDYLKHGESIDDFLEGFPTVGRELAVQVLEESKEH